MDVVGVAVCESAPVFDRRIAGILDEAVGQWYVAPDVRARARWRIVDGYQGLGYAKTTPQEMSALSEIARREGLLLDPVYTGKAFLGLLGEAKAGRVGGSGGATVFLHTGGLFGLFGFAREVRALG